MKNSQRKNKQELRKVNQYKQSLNKLDAKKLEKVIGGEQYVHVESDAEIFGIF